MLRGSFLVLFSLLVVGLPAVPAAPARAKSLKCPVMKGNIADPAKAPRLVVNGQPVPVCCPGCIGELRKTPAKYLPRLTDVVTRKPFAVTASSPKLEHHGALFVFSGSQSAAAFKANPGKYSKPAPSGKGSPQAQDR